jgi:hypothetical protein
MGDWKHRMLEVDIEARTGICSICGPVRVRRKKDNHGGYRYLCAVSQGRWKGKDPNRARVRRRLADRGVTEEAVAEMLLVQENACAICHKPFEEGNQWRQPNLDHDHGNGSLRALLCRHCNIGIGHLGDSPDILRAAAEYVTAFR